MHRLAAASYSPLPFTTCGTGRARRVQMQKSRATPSGAPSPLEGKARQPAARGAKAQVTAQTTPRRSGECSHAHGRPISRGDVEPSVPRLGGLALRAARYASRYGSESPARQQHHCESPHEHKPAPPSASCSCSAWVAAVAAKRSFSINPPARLAEERLPLSGGQELSRIEAFAVPASPL
jgi:hypothetical protein